MQDPYDYDTKDLTIIESREHHSLQRETSRMWRNFWIRVMHRKGMSNVAIAREMELSEGTVRAILAKK